MLHEKLRVTLGVAFLFMLFIGLANTDGITSGGESLKKPPLVAAILDLEDDHLVSDELEKILRFDQEKMILSQTDEYLLLRWSTKINSMTLNMKKVGEESSYFEIWAPGDVKIASGELTQEDKEYTFDLSQEGMSYGDYALFNYGSTEIEINQVAGVELPETKTNKLVDIFAEGFV